MCSKNTLLRFSLTVEQSPSLNGSLRFPTNPVIAPSAILSDSYPILHTERQGLTKRALEVVQETLKVDRGH